MSKLWAFIKSIIDLIIKGFSLLFYYICFVVKKFWKVIVVIFTALISVITLRAFKKQGGKVESEET